MKSIIVARCCFVVISFFIVSLLIDGAIVKAEVLPQPKGEVILDVGGEIVVGNSPSGRARFDLAMLQRYRINSFVTHTPWSDSSYRFKGVSLAEILSELGVRDDAKLRVMALDGYEALVPMKDILPFDPILAFSRNNVPLTRRDRGPLWLVYNRDKLEETKDPRFDSYWVWQIYKMDVE
ncbi:MAG: molybdopterin-dependent oxidoreductase [Alphaproteobacteria bacterium]|nr:molybdopterin-dependent oxidoreductase [Alphaproteobacteria bacterium]